jgi:hypothetical protein
MAAPPPEFNVCLDYCSASGHKMPDQRDDREYQQQVNEPDGHVEGDEAENPRDEQDDR